MADSTRYDLLILTDATASMTRYLESLNQSLPDIIRISALTGCFSNIGVVAYRDYTYGLLTEWSGWYPVGTSAPVGAATTTTREELLNFVKRLKVCSGGDWPEATKTGLACAYQHMHKEATTLILLYTDAPPHFKVGRENYKLEQHNLRKKSAYKEFGRLFADWVSAANALRGEKKAQVISIVHSSDVKDLSPYVFLSWKTGGTCMSISRYDSDFISQLTIDVLLTWLGVEKEGDLPLSPRSRDARIEMYKDSDKLHEVESETDKQAAFCFARSHSDPVRENVLSLAVSKDVLKQHVFGPLGMTGFTERYKIDLAYRELVMDYLTDIIESDVVVLSLNPVFGSLWRTVCNDRLNEARQELVELFGSRVEKIPDPDRKARMKVWLEQSYDFKAEITQLVQSVSEDERYPCVYLDPTLNFNAAQTNDGNEDGEPGTEVSTLTREELLEIGRSCDYRVLKRLGRILARLTCVTSDADLPAHIKGASEDAVPRIPIALAGKKYERKFWKILLHTIVPGTMLAPRPAALLAALSLRMGIRPLQEVADAELFQYGDKWNTLDFPETWNSNCLALVLDADKDFETRVNDGITDRPLLRASMLSKEDRALFRTLVDYEMLEMNLGTSLKASVGWRPKKSKAPLGPLVTCRVCHFPRSVTIMGKNNICGLCDEDVCTCTSTEAHNAAMNGNVSSTDDEATASTWVECSMTDCRAQYVIYNPELLCIRPKCHYCRMAEHNMRKKQKAVNAPVVECVQCLNRVIYPHEYRPRNFEKEEFNCPACKAGQKTIVETSATADKLGAENGYDWLLRNADKRIADAFSGRSLFHTISTAGRDGFADQVEVFPSQKQPLALRLNGKPIHNVPALLAELQNWVFKRRAEAGICSLCFTAFNKRDVRPACGRKGCHQVICNACHRGWYGLNEQGRIINVAALSCPFCRRLPAASVISAYGLNLLGDLRLAVQEAGEWVYAWCSDCGVARRYVERVCAAGAPPEVVQWRCEECVERRRVADGELEDAFSKLKIRHCPRCDVATEKISGCNHIQCTACKTHWCFFCGKEFTSGEIYQHMNAEHGGIYDGGIFDAEDDDDMALDPFD